VKNGKLCTVVPLRKELCFQREHNVGQIYVTFVVQNNSRLTKAILT
jgi:hypothetical protein